MQAKRKLTALLLSLCMLLGMLPMTAFAAGVPAAPTNLKLELTETGLKASWDKPETTGGLDIFEYEVTLYGHFDGTAGEKTKVETKTVQRETTCTFTNTGNAEGVINPTYEVEVRAREGVSGTGDPDNLSGYYVTEWTGWSSSSSASYKTYDFSVITSVNKYYTGVVDVGLPGSENKLHQEGITATGNPDVIKPDGTTSENEKQAVTELLYQYFEKNKATVPELANVTRDNLMVKTVLERIESSRTVDPNNYQIIYEVVDKDYTLYLEFNPETEIVQPDTREIVNAVNLVNVSWNVGMGLTPAFTATVDEADQDKYEVYLEQWIGSDGKSITSEESFNSEISEDEKITTFEEGVTYYYSVWVKAKEGYAISEEASVYLDGRPADNGYTLANNDEPKRPDGSFLSGTFNSLFVMECVFDPLKVNGIEVTSANKDDILGDADGLGATVSYDPDTNTLTLNNATLTVSEDFAAIHALIPDLTIVLKGENQINGSGSTENGIYSNGDLTITGSGRLQIRGTGFGLYGNSAITLTGGADVDIIVDFSSAEAPQPYSAVRALGGLTVDGATLNAKNNATQDASFGTPGINTDLTAINGAKVNISSVNDHGICGDVIVSGAGTVVNASSASGEHYGIFAGQEDIFGELGGDQKGIFTISDGAVVTASGGKGAMRWKRKLYYIEDQENYDIVLLPSKYLKHKADANRSPNTVRRLALSICYYLNYLDQTGTELLQVAKKSFEEQSSHFGQFLYWLVEGRHITDNRTAKTGNGTCNAYLKDVFGFFLYLADNGYTEPLRVLAYNQITVSNAVGVKRTIRSKSFKGYLKEKDRNVRAAQEPEIIDILRACTNLRDQLLLLLLAETGFRIGEILGVDYTKDIDYEKQVLKVYFRDDNDNEARAKNAEYRSAKISRETFEFLLHYLAEYRRLLQRQSLLFINIRGETAGKPMRVESVYDMLDRMEEKTGIKLTPHMLRRYYAVSRRDAGWALELIQLALGHKHLDTTVKYLGILDNQLMTASREFYEKHSDLYGIKDLL
ncbi:MAG: tyrosine-type recombinase/integrase [Ruminococcus sp.]